MEIYDDETGKMYECFLVDDGTLDTVIEVDGREFRFSDTSWARDESGTITDKGFIELCNECIEDLWQYEE